MAGRFIQPPVWLMRRDADPASHLKEREILNKDVASVPIKLKGELTINSQV
jgi:hypothetical protein